MSADAKIRFEKWIVQNEIPEVIKIFLVDISYDSVDILPYLSMQIIDKSNLSIHDKNILKKALDMTIDSDVESQEKVILERDQLEECPDEEILKREQLRWKEFGLAKKFTKWEKDYLPVELFSPDGYWAWNTEQHSLTWKSTKVNNIWTKFNDNIRGWIMSPPVILPSKLGALKFTFNIKLSTQDEGDLPKLQMVLVNDGYNNHISQFFEFPLRLGIEFRFICFIKGIQIGDTFKQTYQFNKLHDSESLDIPGNVLQLPKPPIISIRVFKI